MMRANAGALPLHALHVWEERWPWVQAGMTARGDEDAPFDLRWFGAERPGAPDRWRRLREELGFATVVHAPQVHGADVLFHADLPPGILLTDPADGHATDRFGTLLTVSVADCVPVFLLAPEHQAIALLHAGRMGVAAGILSRGVRALGAAGARAGDLHVHLGPSICGACYEVGPEVHEALGLPRPAGPRPVDLRERLRAHAEAAGVPAAQVTVSEACTRCGPEGIWFSHRGGHAGRQVGYLGLRG